MNIYIYIYIKCQNALKSKRAGEEKFGTAL